MTRTDTEAALDLALAACEADSGVHPAAVFALVAEIRRLRSGDLTEEEFQNLCHEKRDGGPCRFAAGCVEYNAKIFGKNSMLRAIDDVREHPDDV